MSHKGQLDLVLPRSENPGGTVQVPHGLRGRSACAGLPRPCQRPQRPQRPAPRRASRTPPTGGIPRISPDPLLVASLYNPAHAVHAPAQALHKPRAKVQSILTPDAAPRTFYIGSPGRSSVGGYNRGRMGDRKLWGLGWALLLAAVAVTTTASGVEFGAGITSRFVRKLEESVDLPYDHPLLAVPPGANPPQQVHLTQGDYDGKAVIVSFVTVKPSNPEVSYGLIKGNYTWVAKGYTTQYQFYNYTSGYIHHVLVAGLLFNTTYFYKIGADADGPREFNFSTPPAPGPDVPYTFGAIGDLGQTYDSATTLEHYLQSYGQALLYLGDLAYQDTYPFHYQVRFDTWSRFLERSAAYQPYIWTAGNHELDFLPELGEKTPFKPYDHRFPTPYEASNSTAPQWYAIRRGPATIIVLSSYSAYGKYTPQYVWLLDILKEVDRTVTPWLIVLLHSPWYNSYYYHYLEGETMRVVFEPFIVAAKVDLVLAGHVHAYERSYPVSNIKYNITNAECTPEINPASPVYITIGDGGNIEGLAANYTQPQPPYSAFREASFGHGLLDIKNRTTAVWTWHRNQDGEAVSADSLIIRNKIYG